MGLKLSLQLQDAFFGPGCQANAAACVVVFHKIGVMPVMTLMGLDMLKLEQGQL